jgi:DNA replication factor GINS
MDFEDLRNILTREQKSRLAKLEPDFYVDVRAYLDGLREEQQTASRMEAQLLADELETAENRLQRIFELRVGKIVNLASSHILAEIKGIKQDMDAMTPVERDMYDSVLASVRKGWSDIERTVIGRSTLSATEDIRSEEPEPVKYADDRTEDVSEAHEDIAISHITRGGITEDHDNGNLSDYTVVRVLKDVPTFMGADSHHYTLAKNDVVILPNLNANVLCKRRVVSPVTIKQTKGEVIR